jgi:hypothetical protein
MAKKDRRSGSGTTTVTEDKEKISMSNEKDTKDETNVIVDPGLAADAPTGAESGEKADDVATAPAEPATGAAADPAGTGPHEPADAGKVADTLVDREPPQFGAPTAPPPGGNAEEEEPEDKLPIRGNKTATYAILGAVAIAALIGLSVLLTNLVRDGGSGSSTAGTTTAPTPRVTAPVPSSLPAPAPAGSQVLPEVRIPAPRGIDASRCTRDQWSIVGDRLVFRNCATLELATPSGN